MNYRPIHTLFIIFFITGYNLVFSVVTPNRHNLYSNYSFRGKKHSGDDLQV